jgi:[ribosomal protein S5]-alanine N-acetyltransferase
MGGMSLSLPTLDLGLPGWTLRAWRESDAADLHAQANNARTLQFMSDGFSFPYSLETARHWVNRGHIDFGGDNWAIAFNDQAAGGCGIHWGAGPLRCNAEIGYWLGQSYWGHGVATEVVRILTARSFANPIITRVFAPIHDGNTGSMRVVEKNGFVREGVQRKGAIKDGRVIDRVVWASYRKE